MKNVTVYLILSLLVISAAFALKTEEQKTLFEKIHEQDETKDKIEMKDVPENVQKAFNESDYKDYEVKEIYKITEANQVMYEFDVTVENVKWGIYFDPSGKFLGKQEVV